jgi:hypothetical protein
VIEPGASVPGFVVFADCWSDAENLTKLHIRKGSLVSVRGKLLTFGAKAVCLSDCQLQEMCAIAHMDNQETGNGKPRKT